MSTILVCDDDKDIVDAIDIYLTQEGYQVLKAYNGEEAIKVLKEKEVDLLIIDVMMPRLDGIRATLKIREEMSLPIIILSAKSEDADKILGLNIGADDYVVKPFSPNEVMARVRAVLRRMGREEEEKEKKVLTVGNLTINIEAYTVFVGTEKIPMTKKEVETMWILAKNPSNTYNKVLF